jgi:hypothetical protein
MSLSNGTIALLPVDCDRKLLATLLIQLEEIEEQIEGLQQSRSDLLRKISSQSEQTQIGSGAKLF